MTIQHINNLQQSIMVSFYFLEHRFKRSMLEITSSTSYEVLWNYLNPHKKIKLQENITFFVAAGKKAYDIIRLYESGEYFFSQRIINVLSQFVDMSDKCYPIKIKGIDKQYYVIYNLEQYPFLNQDENIFEDEPGCIGVQDKSLSLFSLKHTKSIIVSEAVKDALRKNKVTNIELTECFGCTLEEYKEIKKSKIKPEVHAYRDR